MNDDLGINNPETYVLTDNRFNKYIVLIIPRKAGYCNHLRVSVCLFVCLLAGFLLNYWSDFDEI